MRRPNGLGISRRPCGTSLIDQERILQETDDLERHDRGGRLHARVGPCRAAPAVATARRTKLV